MYGSYLRVFLLGLGFRRFRVAYNICVISWGILIGGGACNSNVDLVGRLKAVTLVYSQSRCPNPDPRKNLKHRNPPKVIPLLGILMRLHLLNPLGGLGINSVHRRRHPKMEHTVEALSLVLCVGSHWRKGFGFGSMIPLPISKAT